MSASIDRTPQTLLAAHVRETMTLDEARCAQDERYNVYLALGLDNADVLFVMGSRAVTHDATDIDAFTAGYAHALAAGSLDAPATSDSFRKGYEAGSATRNATRVHEASVSSSGSHTATP